ncbi:hypothetical protein GGG16DRAFT_126083 [Schizophyllum commune]
MNVLKITLCAKCDNTLSCSYPPPPDLDLLREGHVPSQVENAAIDNDIAVLDNSLAVIDAEIATIHTRLAILQRHRAQLVESKLRRQALVAPIRRLPSELLELVIRAALPPKWATASSGTTRFPLLETCSRIWRTALAMPDIWCKITTTELQIGERFYAIAQRYMDRAASRPVDVLDLSPHFRQDSAFDQWMIAHMGRLRNIKWAIDTRALPVSRVSAPSLKSAILYADWHRDATFYPDPILTFVDAPRLSTITIRNCVSPSIFDLPWTQLQSLTIESATLSPNDLRTLLSCVSLTELDVCVSKRFAAGHDNDSTHPPVVTMNALRVLKLSGCGHLFSALINAPNLHELFMWVLPIRFADASDLFAQFATSVRTMLERSVPPLCSLTMHGFPSCIEDGELENILSILHLVPQLKRLKLGYSSMGIGDIPLLRKLTFRQGQPLLLPELEHIALEYSRNNLQPYPGCVDVLKELVLSRWKEPATSHEGTIVSGVEPTERLRKSECNAELEPRACSSLEASRLDLLRTNSGPSLKDAQLIEVDDETLDASIAAINAQIAVHLAHIESLERDRARLVEAKHRKQALRVPILRLPTEIIELIIRAALPLDSSTAASTTRVPLFQSCRRIRAVALAMTDLWCRIVIPAGDTELKDSFYELAQLYLDRARPLGIQIVDSNQIPQYRQDMRFDQWMIAHFDRFRTATWSMDVGSLPPTRMAAPCLESATFLARYRRGAFDTTPSGLLTIVDAPLLRKVCLGVYVPPLAINLPWAQLSELDLCIFKFRPEYLRVLESCTSLSTLNISIGYNFATPLSPNIVLHGLRTLKLEDFAALLAPCITAPKLPDDVSETRDVILLLPAIERLTISCCTRENLDRNHAFTSLFMIANTDTMHFILPNLEHLTILLEHGNFSTGFKVTLTSLALSQWANGGERPVERLSLRSLDCESSSICDCRIGAKWMKTLEKEGILVDQLTRNHLLRSLRIARWR